MPSLITLIERLGVPFDDTTMLRQALVHTSFLNEHLSRVGDAESNERLEFLGDSIVNAVAAAMLFEQFPQATEGQLTEMRAALIKSSALADYARSLDLGAFLRLGRGAEREQGREREGILADAFEAVVAAIYLAGGLEAARGFLEPLYQQQLAGISSHGGRADDYKSRLQAAIQAERNQTPAYRTIGASGPEHRREFTVEVYVGDEVLGSGSGSSKQIAEQAAARDALDRREHHPPSHYSDVQND
ncbi:MAG TPA: ribonuclease III [Roseiflexaceae bacterium]|nr:ribonuclease III [Roseiflexaceae bacterium]HMP43007.1 ribonuclease III [Roseiflexaceae bacterium]